MFLRLGSREVPLKLVFLIAGGLAAVSVGVTVAVMMVRGSTDTVGGIDDVAMPLDRFDWIGIDDFVLEDELARGTEPRWIPFRPRMDRWTREQVQEHWIDPREIGIDVLETRVNQDIRRRLEDVP